MKASKKTKSLSDPASIKIEKHGFNLPSHDALAQILPDYLAGRAKTELQNATPHEQNRAETTETAQTNKPNINRTYKKYHLHKRPTLHDFGDDPHVEKINNLQTKELENYRSAMTKMAEDILLLRTQIVALEAANSQLRSDLSLHQDLGRDLLHDIDIDVMTKAEISDYIASLKFKLASEISKATSQRDRIQQLQNELIKKNDSEKELLKLKRIHRQQEQLQQHQNHLAEMAALKATVKQQEKVIEKLEKALDKKLSENRRSGDKRFMPKIHRVSDHRKEETESAMASENSRLREEVSRIRQQPATVIIQPAQTKEVLPIEERLRLLNKLDKAEARVQALEAQLEENAKLWGSQKQEMLTQLSELRHGFVCTCNTMLHSSSRAASESVYQQSRQKKHKSDKLAGKKYCI